MTWTADDRREHGPWCVVSGEAGFAHSGAIVYDESGNIVIHSLGLVDYRDYTIKDCGINGI